MVFFTVAIDGYVDLLGCIIPGVLYAFDFDLHFLASYALC